MEGIELEEQYRASVPHLIHRTSRLSPPPLLQVTPNNTAYNTPGFDNVGLAFLTNWQIMTVSGPTWLGFEVYALSFRVLGVPDQLADHDGKRLDLVRVYG